MKATKKWIARLLAAVLTTYLLCAGMLAWFQRDLLYHGAPNAITPAQAGLSPQVKEASFEHEGAQLTYWWHPPKRGKPLIVYFHGNAGSLASRAERLKAMMQQGFGIAIMNYRGFGKSTGKPSEKAIYSDAERWMAILQERHHSSDSPIVFYGESLGTGVATYLAAQRSVDALVLQSPFTSVLARAQELYPWAPVRWLLRDRFDSLSRITSIDAPLLIVHGLNDEVIPPAHAKALFAAAKEPKQLILKEMVGHNNFDALWLAQQVALFYQTTLAQ